MRKIILTVALFGGFSSVASAQQNTNWVVEFEADPMTDIAEGAARLTNSRGDKLVFACNGKTEKTLSVQFLPRAFLGSSDNLVMIRFDADEPFPSVLWTYTTQGAYTVSPPSIQWFSTNLGDGERRIRVRAFNYRDQPVDAEFWSQNGRQAINQIREICGENAI